jgi:predicted molibdopterin-dependent oxidoreductase YjgC
VSTDVRSPLAPPPSAPDHEAHARAAAGDTDGRLTRVEFEPSPGLEDGLTLVTGRVLEHYNSGAMTRRTGNRDLHPGDVLEIHPRDAESRGITDGVRVRIASGAGEAHAEARVTDRVPAGVVFLSFHFPETGANAVTGDVRDRLSGCPEYKVTSVTVRPASKEEAVVPSNWVETRSMG